MPKVFLSYSYDNDLHKNWVNDLACKLRMNGIDVIFDQFEARLGADLPLFMEQGLSKSNRVICICSDLYNKKSNSGFSGVGYEKRIICKEITKDSSTSWVIPLIRNNASEEKLPLFLSSLRYISFEDDSKYFENIYDLLRELHSQNNVPSIGKNPFEHNADVIGKIDEIKQIKSSLAFSNCTNSNTQINYLSNSGVYTVGTDIFEFKTRWSDASINAIHAYADNLEAIACTGEEININNLDLEKHDFSSRCRTARLGESIIWINKNGKILITKIEKIAYENNQKHVVTLSYKIIEDCT